MWRGRTRCSFTCYRRGGKHYEPYEMSTTSLREGELNKLVGFLIVVKLRNTMNNYSKSLGHWVYLTHATFIGNRNYYIFHEHFCNLDQMASSCRVRLESLLNLGHFLEAVFGCSKFLALACASLLLLLESSAWMANHLYRTFRFNGLHPDGGCRCLCFQLLAAAAEPASVGLHPGSTKFFPVEIVDQDVCGRVNTHKQVRHSSDDIHYRNFADGAVVTKISSARTNNQFIKVGDDFERLAEDEQWRHSNQDQTKSVLLLLLFEEGSPRMKTSGWDADVNHRWHGLPLSRRISQSSSCCWARLVWAVDQPGHDFGWLKSAPLEAGGDFDFFHLIRVFEVIVIVTLKLASEASGLGNLDDDEDVQDL